MRLDEVIRLVTQKLKTMIDNPDIIMVKRKALSALLPYVVCPEQGAYYETIDAFTHIAKAVDSERFIWHRIKLDQLLTLVSPRVPWGSGSHDETPLAKWALAVSVIPPLEALSWSVIDVLLHTASDDYLRPQIPTGVWAWLKKWQSLPSQFFGWPKSTNGAVVCQVRELGDIEVLKGYLLLVWSEWNCIESPKQGSVGSRSGLAEMQISIQEDFGGVGMGHHRKNLINRLDYVLGQLDRGLEYLIQQKPDVDEAYVQMAKEQYQGLRRVLLEANREAANPRARMSPRFIHFCLLTPADTCRIPFDLYVRSATPVSMISCLKNVRLLPPTVHLVYTPSQACHPHTALDLPRHTNITQPFLEDDGQLRGFCSTMAVTAVPLSFLFCLLLVCANPFRTNTLFRFYFHL